MMSFTLEAATREGEYRIYSGDSFLTVYVSDPDAGYYSASDIKVANYIEDQQIQQMEETTVYFAYKKNPEEGRTLAIEMDGGNPALMEMLQWTLHASVNRSNMT